jgi:hypothetical protein
LDARLSAHPASRRYRARCTLVTRLCANGEVIGIQISALPVSGSPPLALGEGPFHERLAHRTRSSVPPPAISGVIDAFGLGGQGLRHAPSLLERFSCWMKRTTMPRALDARGRASDPRTSFALDAAAVAKSKTIADSFTGMVSPDGRGLSDAVFASYRLNPS